MTELSDGPITGRVEVDYSRLAGALLEAVDIYENSYVRADRDVTHYGVTSNPGHYALSYWQAAAKALPDDPVGARVVELLMITAWNDAQDWARMVLEKRT